MFKVTCRFGPAINDCCVNQCKTVSGTKWIHLCPSGSSNLTKVVCICSLSLSFLNWTKQSTQKWQARKQTSCCLAMRHRCTLNSMKNVVSNVLAFLLCRMCSYTCTCFELPLWAWAGCRQMETGNINQPVHLQYVTVHQCCNKDMIPHLLALPAIFNGSQNV